MYQAENTNFKTNESFTQEFTRSCLGRILIAGEHTSQPLRRAT